MTALLSHSSMQNRPQNGSFSATAMDFHTFHPSAMQTVDVVVLATCPGEDTQATASPLRAGTRHEAAMVWTWSVEGFMPGG